MLTMKYSYSLALRLQAGGNVPEKQKIALSLIKFSLLTLYHLSTTETFV